MTRKDLIDYICSKNPSISEFLNEKAIDAFFDTIKNSLGNGKRVEIRNFGVFDTKNVRGGARRNPSNGEPVQTKDHRAIRFKVSRLLVERLTKNEKMKDLNQ